MKKRRFAAGGETDFSPEQEAWLGKADRTDPYILARMRRAVPDKPKLAPVEDRQFTPVEQKAPAEPSDIADMKRTASSASDEDDTASMKRSAVSVKASRPAAAPVRSKPYAGKGGSGRGMEGGPTADEMAAYSASQKTAYETPYDRRNRENREKGVSPSALAERIKNAAVRKQSVPLAELSLHKVNPRTLLPMKKGGNVKKYAKGGSIDGCAQRGKTKGRYL